MGLIDPVWIIAIAAMWTFYIMATYELQKGAGKKTNQVLWPLFSIVLSFVVIRAFEGGVIAVLAGQLFVFVGIGVWRAVRE